MFVSKSRACLANFKDDLFFPDPVNEKFSAETTALMHEMAVEFDKSKLTFVTNGVTRSSSMVQEENVDIELIKDDKGGVWIGENCIDWVEQATSVKICKPCSDENEEEDNTDCGMLILYLPQDRYIIFSHAY